MRLLAKPHVASLCEERSFFFRNRARVGGAASDFPAKKIVLKIA
jgi:hypothetical protein